MVPIYLSTERLDLRPLELDDTLLFHRINTDPFVRQYLWDDELISEETARSIIEQNIQHFEQDRFGLWKIYLKDSQTLIGYTGLWHFFQEPQPQLIYALLETYCSRGLATEAARAILTYAFSELSFKYLIAATDKPHLASQKVAHRLGMRLVEEKVKDGKSTLFFRIDKHVD